MRNQEVEYLYGFYFMDSWKLHMIVKTCLHLKYEGRRRVREFLIYYDNAQVISGADGAR